MATKLQKDVAQLELVKLQEWSELAHKGMPLGGNAHLEVLLVAIADNIRMLKKEIES